jgi:hypothetical protein
MAEEKKIKTVIRTQVYLNDPDYFCNKSWTMSYNLNTTSWISFHSYIPNFYIGENNFFYSGLNGCCDDGEAGGFQAIAGVIDKTPPTTTSTTTFYPSPRTTTSTTTLDCGIDGVAIITDCSLDGTAVITVPATTTTTICQRPSSLLTQFVFVEGYTLVTDPEVIFSGSEQEACAAISSIEYISASITQTNGTLSEFNIYANTTTTELQIGNIVYYGDGTDCTLVPDGFYLLDPTLDRESSNYVYEVSGGIIVNIINCDCGTTTTTTTLPPDVTECCGILFSSDDAIYYSNRSELPQINLLNVPGYVSSLGIAMTANYLWSIDTDIKKWTIDLSPFSATSSGTIALPMGYTAGLGIVAKNDGILISTDTSASPNDVTELDVTGGTAVSTVMFSLQANRTSTGNMLYTTDGKLIMISQDTITFDNYVTQYDYATGTIEVDLNIGIVAPTSLYECNCDIYLTDAFGNLYTIIKIYPYVLLNLGININISSIDSATQVGSCVVSSITDNTTTTTSTSSSSTTTTTTTTP